MNGGRGYSPEDVAQLTPDQIYFLLCEIGMLKRTDGRRTKKIAPSQVGMLKGRTSDGKLVEAPVGGKSLVQQMMEKEQQQQKPRRPRNRRGK